MPDPKVLDLFEALDSLTDNQIHATRFLYVQKTGIKTDPMDHLPTRTQMFGYYGMLMDQADLDRISKEVQVAEYEL